MQTSETPTVVPINKPLLNTYSQHKDLANLVYIIELVESFGKSLLLLNFFKQAL